MHLLHSSVLLAAALVAACSVVNGAEQGSPMTKQQSMPQLPLQMPPLPPPPRPDEERPGTYTMETIGGRLASIKSFETQLTRFDERKSTITIKRVIFPTQAMFIQYSPNYSQLKQPLFGQLDKTHIESPVKRTGKNSKQRSNRPIAEASIYLIVGSTMPRIEKPKNPLQKAEKSLDTIVGGVIMDEEYVEKLSGKIYIYEQLEVMGSRGSPYIGFSNKRYGYEKGKGTDVHWWIHLPGSDLFRTANQDRLGPKELPLLEFPLLMSLNRCLQEARPDTKPKPPGAKPNTPHCRLDLSLLTSRISMIDVRSFAIKNVERWLEVDPKAMENHGQAFLKMNDDDRKELVKPANPVLTYNLLFPSPFLCPDWATKQDPKKANKTNNGPSYNTALVEALIKKMYASFEHAVKESYKPCETPKRVFIHFYVWEDDPSGFYEEPLSYDSVILTLIAMIAARALNVNLIIYQESDGEFYNKAAKHFREVWPEKEEGILVSKLAKAIHRLNLAPIKSAPKSKAV